MPNLITNYNLGSDLRNENPELNRQLSQMYSTTANVVNQKISKYVTNGTSRPHVNPPASSDFNKSFEEGDIFVRTDTNSAWIMSSRTSSFAVTWTLIT